MKDDMMMSGDGKDMNFDKSMLLPSTIILGMMALGQAAAPVLSFWLWVDKYNHVVPVGFAVNDPSPIPEIVIIQDHTCISKLGKIKKTKILSYRELVFKCRHKCTGAVKMCNTLYHYTDKK